MFPFTTRNIHQPACVPAEDSLLRQDDIWMLDGDDPQEPLPRVPRPDHLDFLRITPPEDDIIGDTPYYPKLECTVRVVKHEQHEHLQIIFDFPTQSSVPCPPPPTLSTDFSLLGHPTT